MAYCHTVVYVTIFVYISFKATAVPLGHPVSETKNASGPDTDLKEEIPPAHNATTRLVIEANDAELNKGTDVGNLLNSDEIQLALETMVRKTALERRRALMKRDADRFHSRCCYIDVFCIRGCRRRSRIGLVY